MWSSRSWSWKVWSEAVGQCVAESQTPQCWSAHGSTTLTKPTINLCSVWTSYWVREWIWWDIEYEYPGLGDNPVRIWNCVEWSKSELCRAYFPVARISVRMDGDGALIPNIDQYDWDKKFDGLRYKVSVSNRWELREWWFEYYKTNWWILQPVTVRYELWFGENWTARQNFIDWNPDVSILNIDPINLWWYRIMAVN